MKEREKIVTDKQSVWYRIRKNRCLVFTTGFFEHRDIGAKKKLPYFIKVKDETIFCFAGLYNYSPIPDTETGEVIGTFTIVTRPGNPLLNKIREWSQRVRQLQSGSLHGYLAYLFIILGLLLVSALLWKNP